MERYLIKTQNNNIKIIYGNYLKAIKQSKDGKIKIIPENINDDEIIYKRIKFEEL